MAEYEFQMQPQQAQGTEGGSSVSEMFWLIVKTAFITLLILFAIRYAIKRGKEAKPDEIKEDGEKKESKKKKK